MGATTRTTARVNLFVSALSDQASKGVAGDSKWRANIAKHGLDFADAEKVFAGPMVLLEDDRTDYGEQRMIGLGFLDYLVVLIVPVETDDTVRIISMRKADNDETNLYYENVGYF